jgi:hypothetical protein
MAKGNRDDQGWAAAFPEVIPADKVFRCIKLVVLAGGVCLGLHLAGFQAWFASDAESVGALLQIVGTLYSVLYAFATYVIWGQFTAVENEILKESGALKDLLLFSNRLKANTREPMVRAVKSYARAVVDGEWRALANAEGTDKTDRLFSDLIASVTDAKPDDDTERMVYERLLDIANQANAPGRAAGAERETNAANSPDLRNLHGTHHSISAAVFSFPQRGFGGGVDRDHHIAPLLRAFRAD